MKREDRRLLWVYGVLLPVLFLLGWFSWTFLQVVYVGGLVCVILYNFWDMVWGDGVGGY